MSPDLDPESVGNHLDRLFRSAWALTGNQHDAEDLVQETYVRVLSRPRFLQHDDDLGYMLRALRNTFLTRRRDASRRPREVELSEDFPGTPGRVMGDPQATLEAREVYAAIASLPEEYRDTLVAVDIAGLSYKEAARALGTKEGTVMSRLYRARNRVVDAIDGPAATLPATRP